MKEWMHFSGTVAYVNEMFAAVAYVCIKKAVLEAVVVIHSYFVVMSYEKGKKTCSVGIPQYLA